MRLIKALGIVTLLINISWAEFNPSRFNFGCDWEYPSKNGRISELKDVLDYITVWCHEPAFINEWHGAMIDTCRKHGQTPVFYGYLVAGLSGLGDADVGGRLDAEGGAWLRSNINKVLQTYEEYAQKIAGRYGTSKPVIWLMEPDYYQYCNGNGNDLSFGDAAKYMSQMIAAIKKHLPNAYFSLDISPWNNDQASYINNFDMNLFSFMANSGGRTQAGSDRIRSDNNNNVTWTQVNSASGKCIIADAGYGVGGKPTGHASDWDDLNNLKNRMKDGVVAITHKDPKSGWGSTIASLKSSLSGVTTKCSDVKFKISYSLNITASSGGKVTVSPEATAYDSGKTVTITAVPDPGYRLAGWSGDTSGASMNLTVTMTKDLNISAEFVDVNAKPTYVLTVNVTGSGVVKLDPEKVRYDSGATVALEAFVANNASFTSWGGDLSGAVNPANIVMNCNKTVTASFTGSNIVTTNLVKNGDFSGGDAEWTFGAYESAEASGEVAGGEFKVTHEKTGDEEWNIQLFQPDISLEKGKKYLFSFDAYAQSTTKIVANIGMTEDPFTSYSKSKTIELTTSKTKYKIVFTMKSESTSAARLEFNCGLQTASWAVDNIELVEEIEVGVERVSPFAHDRNAVPAVARNERTVISWYDHAGRLLHSVSGDYSIVKKQTMVHYTGSAVAVIKTGNRQIVKRTVTLKK